MKRAAHQINILLYVTTSKSAAAVACVCKASQVQALKLRTACLTSTLMLHCSKATISHVLVLCSSIFVVGLDPSGTDTNATSGSHSCSGATHLDLCWFHVVNVPRAESTSQRCKNNSTQGFHV